MSKKSAKLLNLFLPLIPLRFDTRKSCFQLKLYPSSKHNEPKEFQQIYSKRMEKFLCIKLC